MVRQSGQNVIPAPDLALSAGDTVMIITKRQDVIGETLTRLGKLEPSRLAKDRGRPRLHSRFRHKGRRGRRATRPLRCCRISDPYPSRSGDMTSTSFHPRFDARIRRSRRHVMPPSGGTRSESISANCESYRRVQLRRRSGLAWSSACLDRAHSNSGSRRRNGDARHRRRSADRALIVGRFRRTGRCSGSCRSPRTSCCAISGSRCSSPRSASMRDGLVRTVAECGFTMLFIGIAIC